MQSCLAYTCVAPNLLTQKLIFSASKKCKFKYVINMKLFPFSLSYPPHYVWPAIMQLLAKANIGSTANSEHFLYVMAFKHSLAASEMCWTAKISKSNMILK